MVCLKLLITDRKSHMQITRTLLAGTFVALAATSVACSNDHPAPVPSVVAVPATPVVLKPLTAPDGVVFGTETKLHCTASTPIELPADMRRNVDVGTTGVRVTTTHGANMALVSPVAVYDFTETLPQAKGAYVTIKQPGVSFGLFAAAPSTNTSFQVAWPADAKLVSVNAKDFSSGSDEVVSLTLCLS